MKKITLSSTFNANFREVKENFNKNLFEYLLPKIPPMKIEKYEGNNLGNEIHLSIAKNKWISVISDIQDQSDEYSFTDTGKSLPYPLKQWNHKHRIVKLNENEVAIIDEIEFRCSNNLLTNIF